ncbi:MAG TPA: hypothetical protein DCL43_12555 [Chitinophagaceae bacterium]|nr:hypothetical protein [Chitinophagaceae bacterium]HAN40030.1 hypothetical protein [Chitinophagaceae bacterium]
MYQTLIIFSILAGFLRSTAQSTAPAPPFTVRLYPITPLRANDSTLYKVATNNFKQVASVYFQPQQQPFFCKQEWLLEKKTNINLKLRMGSVEQCNYLEGKTPFLPKP